MKHNDYCKQHVLEYIDKLDFAWLANKNDLEMFKAYLNILRDSWLK